MLMHSSLWNVGPPRPHKTFVKAKKQTHYPSTSLLWRLLLCFKVSKSKWDTNCHKNMSLQKNMSENWHISPSDITRKERDFYISISLSLGMQNCKYATVIVHISISERGFIHFSSSRVFFGLHSQTERERQDHERLIGIKAMTDK